MGLNIVPEIITRMASNALTAQASAACTFCGNGFHDDGRGACVACGGPGGKLLIQPRQPTPDRFFGYDVSERRHPRMRVSIVRFEKPGEWHEIQVSDFNAMEAGMSHLQLACQRFVSELARRRRVEVTVHGDTERVYVNA